MIIERKISSYIKENQWKSILDEIRKSVELEDKWIPSAGYEIFDDEGNAIGKVTVHSMSPMMGKGIGLGYVKTGFHSAGTTIFIQIRNKTLAAKVVKLPIYKK